MRAGDLLLYVDSLTSFVALLVWWVCIAALGIVVLWRSTQNPRIVDLRITGVALVLWVGTDVLGAIITRFLLSIFDNILAAVGLYMSFDLIADDLGDMIGGVLVVGMGYGVASALLSVAGGPTNAAPPKPAGAKASAPAAPRIAAGVPGGPPGAPGPPGPPS
ncbi:MAG: hypothetical protein H6737_02845 [Alphaproteobacteria bacterium]|nr:hypothetical protein [Alphaproteobacteria bacterium]